MPILFNTIDKFLHNATSDMPAYLCSYCYPSIISRSNLAATPAEDSESVKFNLIDEYSVHFEEYLNDNSPSLPGNAKTCENLRLMIESTSIKGEQIENEMIEQILKVRKSKEKIETSLQAQLVDAVQSRLRRQKDLQNRMKFLRTQKSLVTEQVEQSDISSLYFYDNDNSGFHAVSKIVANKANEINVFRNTNLSLSEEVSDMRRKIEHMKKTRVLQPSEHSDERDKFPTAPRKKSFGELESTEAEIQALLADNAHLNVEISTLRQEIAERKQNKAKLEAALVHLEAEVTSLIQINKEERSLMTSE